VPIKRIVNASPLTLVTKIGRIDLHFADDIDAVVPTPVLQEVLPDPGDAADPIVWAPVPETLSRWKLDPGEESVLTVALQSPGASSLGGGS
jgi:hypothetical protein